MVAITAESRVGGVYCKTSPHLARPRCSQPTALDAVPTHLARSTRRRSSTATPATGDRALPRAGGRTHTSAGGGRGGCGGHGNRSVRLDDRNGCPAPLTADTAVAQQVAVTPATAATGAVLLVSNDVGLVRPHVCRYTYPRDPRRQSGQLGRVQAKPSTLGRNPCCITRAFEHSRSASRQSMLAERCRLEITVLPGGGVAARRRPGNPSGASEAQCRRAPPLGYQ